MNGGTASGGTVFETVGQHRDDSAGNLHGTTRAVAVEAFKANAQVAASFFKLKSGGTETVLHAFCSKKDGRDGASFLAGVVFSLPQ